MVGSEEGTSPGATVVMETMKSRKKSDRIETSRVFTLVIEQAANLIQDEGQKVTSRSMRNSGVSHQRGEKYAESCIAAAVICLLVENPGQLCTSVQLMHMFSILHTDIC